MILVDRLVQVLQYTLKNNIAEISALEKVVVPAGIEPASKV